MQNYQDFDSLEESIPGCYSYKIKPSIRCLKNTIIDTLITKLEANGHLLGRICFHESHEDPIQSMIIALNHKYKVKKHIHRGVEIIKIIRGELIITEHNKTTSNCFHLSNKNLLFCRMSKGVIHSVKSKRLGNIHEIGTGPLMKIQLYMFN